MVAAIYARVSTADQHNEQQVSELTAYCDRCGWAHQAYQDTMSGAAKQRPALLRLMEDARLRKVDVVVVSKIDRFGRSLTDLVSNLRLLESWKVRFIAVSQGIDTDASNPASKLLMHILAAIAEFERELIIERTRAGVDRARANGSRFGRPLKVFRRDQVAALRAEGRSYKQIAQELGVSVGLVYKVANQ